MKYCLGESTSKANITTKTCKVTGTIPIGMVIHAVTVINATTRPQKTTDRARDSLEFVFAIFPSILHHASICLLDFDALSFWLSEAKNFDSEAFSLRFSDRISDIAPKAQHVIRQFVHYRIFSPRYAVKVLCVLRACIIPRTQGLSSSNNHCDG